MYFFSTGHGRLQVSTPVLDTGLRQFSLSYLKIASHYSDDKKFSYHIFFKYFPNNTRNQPNISFSSIVNTVSHDTVSHDTVRHDTVSHDTVSHDTVSHNTVRHDTMSHDTVRHDIVSHDTVSHNTVSHYTVRYDIET